MAGNAFAKVVRREYNRGLWDGWSAFAMVALVAGYNVADEVFVNDEQYFKFFRLFEEECVRIFAEECHNDPQNATLILMERTDELRKRANLEDLHDETT